MILFYWTHNGKVLVKRGTYADAYKEAFRQKCTGKLVAHEPITKKPLFVRAAPKFTLSDNIVIIPNRLCTIRNRFGKVTFQVELPPPKFVKSEKIRFSQHHMSSGRKRKYRPIPNFEIPSNELPPWIR